MNRGGRQGIDRPAIGLMELTMETALPGWGLRERSQANAHFAGDRRIQAVLCNVCIDAGREASHCGDCRQAQVSPGRNSTFSTLPLGKLPLVIRFSRAAAAASPIS